MAMSDPRSSDPVTQPFPPTPGIRGQEAGPTSFRSGEHGIPSPRPRLRSRPLAAAILVLVFVHTGLVPGSAAAWPSSGRIYGPGIAADSKNNMIIDDGKLSHRFRSSTSSRLLSVRFQQRGGHIYSKGDGGALRISVQADDGRASHRPSGRILASVVMRPGNPRGDWTTYRQVRFPSPPLLRRGRVYHIVFENVSRTPRSDYISVNEIFTFDQLRPRQPGLGDAYAVLYKRGGVWQLMGRDTANMDLTYANGVHDGQAYIENMCLEFGVISGASHMVRERFTVSGRDRRVSRAWVRVKRTHGDSPLVISLRRAGAGVIARGRVSAGRVPSMRAGCTRGGAVWVGVRFERPVRLQKGATYDLHLSTDAGTRYTADPIREGTDSGYRSYRFTDGDAQRTTNGGSRWSNLYQWSPVDLQFYLR